MCGSTKPFGYSTFTSSCNIPFKNALLTSIRYSLKFKWLAMAKNILMDFSLATGAKFSSKSIPSTYVYPWATSVDLFLITVLCSSDLFLKIHLVPITFTPFGLGTNSYTSFRTNWWSSSWVELTQLASWSTSSTFFRFKLG